MSKIEPTPIVHHPLRVLRERKRVPKVTRVYIEGERLLMDLECGHTVPGRVRWDGTFKRRTRCGQCSWIRSADA